MEQREMAGVLLVTYKGGQDKQPIRWVRLSDFTNLQSRLDGHASQAESARSIRQQVASLRAQGITDAQLAASGVDLRLFEQMAAAHHTWPLISYTLHRHPATGLYLRFGRIHHLELPNITSIELVQQQRVETP